MSKVERSLPQKRARAALPLPGAPPSASGGGPHHHTTGTIDAYYLSRHCAVCDAHTAVDRPICPACLSDPQAAAAALETRASALEAAAGTALAVCLACGGGGGEGVGGLERVACVSLDCALFYERRKLEHEVATARDLAEAGLASLEP